MKLQKEHDYQIQKLSDWKKKFKQQLDEVARSIKDFVQKDRMSEAEQYKTELDDIARKIEEFKEEVHLIKVFSLYFFTCRRGIKSNGCLVAVRAMDFKRPIVSSANHFVA